VGGKRAKENAKDVKDAPVRHGCGGGALRPSLGGPLQVSPPALRLWWTKAKSDGLLCAGLREVTMIGADDNDELSMVESGTPPVTLDFSRAIPLVPSVEQRARALQGALFYASHQDPDQYARLLRIQEQTGIPPVISKGHETEIEQMLDATLIDPHAFTAIAPRMAVWASNPDNAAVAGVREIQRLGGVEQSAAAMRMAALQAASLRAAKAHAAAQNYSVTATNPHTQHQIGTNDGGRTWHDVQTGKRAY
jgi:hypothetical protein